MTTDVEEDDERLSRSVHQFLARLANHVFLSIPQTEDPWEWWNTLRTLCGNNSKLHLGQQSSLRFRGKSTSPFYDYFKAFSCCMCGPSSLLHIIIANSKRDTTL